ncbi:MAG: Uma2 family endonuclease [Chloroflexi bacterium]|nr:Uma2 family endonuclease [Chloroflexota bacterium]
MSLQEFLALPEEKPALEFQDGVVTQKMAAKPVHGSIQSFLLRTIDQFARPRRLGIVFAETRFAHDNWSPVPDVAFYRRESLTVRRAPRDFTAAPDLAIEILSPGQTVNDLLQKSLDYLARGTLVAVVVSPPDETVLVVRQGETLAVLRGDRRINLDDVLPGLQLTVEQLFQAVNWDWLDEPPEIAGDAQTTASEAQADDAAASGRSDG